MALVSSTADGIRAGRCALLPQRVGPFRPRPPMRIRPEVPLGGCLGFSRCPPLRPVGCVPDDLRHTGVAVTARPDLAVVRHVDACHAPRHRAGGAPPDRGRLNSDFGTAGRETSMILMSFPLLLAHVFGKIAFGRARSRLPCWRPASRCGWNSPEWSRAPAAWECTGLAIPVTGPLIVQHCLAVPTGHSRAAREPRGPDERLIQANRRRRG